MSLCLYIIPLPEINNGPFLFDYEVKTEEKNISETVSFGEIKN